MLDTSRPTITAPTWRSRHDREKIPSPDILRKLLAYDRVTGKLFWKPRDVSFFKSLKSSKTWNTQFSGTEALTCMTSCGYLHGNIFMNKFRAHRVIWAIETGAWPVKFIDHINGIRNDNRIVNLREATNSENQKNRGISKKNSSGATGVNMHFQYNKWVASICVNYERKHLGVFDNIADAIEARKSAEKFYGITSRQNSFWDSEK